MQTDPYPRSLLKPPIVAMASKLGVLAMLISHGLVAVMIGCAAFRSMPVALFPYRFRLTNGSLLFTFGLNAFMWIQTAIAQR